MLIRAVPFLSRFLFPHLPLGFLSCDLFTLTETKTQNSHCFTADQALAVGSTLSGFNLCCLGSTRGFGNHCLLRDQSQRYNMYTLKTSDPPSMQRTIQVGVDLSNVRAESFTMSTRGGEASFDDGEFVSARLLEPFANDISTLSPLFDFIFHDEREDSTRLLEGNSTETPFSSLISLHFPCTLLLVLILTFRSVQRVVCDPDHGSWLQTTQHDHRSVEDFCSVLSTSPLSDQNSRPL